MNLVASLRSTVSFGKPDGKIFHVHGFRGSGFTDGRYEDKSPAVTMNLTILVERGKEENRGAP
jgi:hypothetical protein